MLAFDDNGPPVAIEPLDHTLAVTMAEIHRRSFLRSWTVSDFRRLVAASHCVALGAYAAGDMTGFILISIAGEEAEVLTLAVDEPWRRRGVAGALLEGAIAEAARQGADALLLEVGISNAAAQGLYRRAGFLSVGRRRDYYDGADGPEDALIMRRSIGRPLLAASPALSHPD